MKPVAPRPEDQNPQGEAALLQVYRSLPKDLQATVLQFAEAAKRVASKRLPTNVIPIR